VAGAKLQFESGLQKPAEVEIASRDWRADSDQLGRFIEERCIVDENFKTPAAGLYAEYKRWAETGGEHPMTSRAFSAKMPDRGYSKKETNRGTAYLGIGLRAPETDS
jgi:putative DNA primase/helicase